MKSYFVFVFLIFIIQECNIEDNRKMLLDDVYAVGNITKDTVFNGSIKFYDTSTNNLVLVANYKSGILNGERIDYYTNGQPKGILNYENGKQNGIITTFDSAGKILQKQNFYYDLRVGPSISFKNDEPIQYYFYSLENKELFHIDYDSIKGKKLEQINENKFFFYHYSTFTTSDSDNLKTELFLYLPNPPKLNFKYSLCVIDNSYKVQEIVKEFNSNNHWEKIHLNYQYLKPENFYALKLEIDNSLLGDEKISKMFKML